MEHSELDFDINHRLTLTLRLVFTSLLTISSFVLYIFFCIPIIVGYFGSILMISA